MDKTESNRVIDCLGGTVAVAKLFRVTKGAVSQWRENGIPAARELHLRDRHPELFRDGLPSREEAA